MNGIERSTTSAANDESAESGTPGAFSPQPFPEIPVLQESEGVSHAPLILVSSGGTIIL
jgi:hypothetical protein